MVLTNAGLFYFNTHKQGDFKPRKYFPLNQFSISDLEEKVVKKKNAFKIIFEKHEVKKDLILAANTHTEKEDWIKALYEF
jgi:hypothetical protein